MRILSAALGLALISGLGPAAVAGVGNGTLSAQVTLTTDYVFRGISQTREEPALQAGLDYRHDSGLFVGIWGSNVDFPGNEPRDRPRQLEVDLYLGVGRPLGRGWSGIASLVRYDYSASRPDLDYSYNEAFLGLRYSDRLALFVAYSDSVFGSDEPRLTYELTAGYPAPHRLDLSLGVGYSDQEGSFAASYAFWSLGLSTTLSRFTVALSAIGTDAAGREIWGRIADDRLVVSTTIAVR